MTVPVTPTTVQEQQEQKEHKELQEYNSYQHGGGGRTVVIDVHDRIATNGMIYIDKLLQEEGGGAEDCARNRNYSSDSSSTNSSGSFGWTNSISNSNSSCSSSGRVGISASAGESTPASDDSGTGYDHRSAVTWEETHNKSAGDLFYSSFRHNRPLHSPARKFHTAR